MKDSRLKKSIIEYLIIEDRFSDISSKIIEINRKLKKDNKDIKGEIWIDVIGYKGLYKLSNFRRVKSMRKYLIMGDIITIKPEIILSPFFIKGYARVKLTKHGIPKTYTIHRLMALHFIRKSKGRLNVNHKNGIKSDNRIENLEWCTQKENMCHASKLGLIKSSEKSIKGLVERNKLRSGAKHYMARKVFNTKTGIYYDTVRQAAEIENIKLSALYEKLIGKYLNNTNLIYV